MGRLIIDWPSSPYTSTAAEGEQEVRGGVAAPRSLWWKGH